MPSPAGSSLPPLPVLGNAPTCPRPCPQPRPPRPPQPPRPSRPACACVGARLPRILATRIGLVPLVNFP
eukprot:3260833-Rhodomonas_salina.1